MTADVLMVRIDPTADASLAAMRARSKFGIAMAAMIKIIATTISNSISEKPFCFLLTFDLSPNKALNLCSRQRPFLFGRRRHTIHVAYRNNTANFAPSKSFSWEVESRGLVIR